MSVFPGKFLKKLPTGFVESVESMNANEIKAKILESESHVYEVEKAKDEDEKLKVLKEELKDLNGGYRDAKATETAKIKYCIYVLEERGTSVGSSNALGDSD